MRRIIGGRSPSEVFSGKRPSFKKLGLDPDSLSDDRLVELMLAEPRMIRHPLIGVADELIIGSDKRATERAFGDG